MSAIVCGIDIGTTNLKVLLADSSGKTLWVKSVPSPHLHDGLGPVTDVNAVMARLEELVIEGWRAVGKGKPIAAIASTGIGEDGVGVDAALKPLGHAVAWHDRRGEALAAALGQTPAGRAHPMIVFDYSSTAGKWMWLHQHRPQELANAHCWLTMTDMPAAVWSGTPFISETLAVRTTCYDVVERQWVAGLLASAGAPPLPPVRRAGDVIGTMRPGPLVASGAANSSTLLVAGGHDHTIASSAIQRIDPLARIDSIGTANLVYGETAALVPGIMATGLAVSVPVSGRKGVSCLGVTEFSKSLHEAVGDDTILRHLIAAGALDKPAKQLASSSSPGDHLQQIVVNNTRRAKGFLDAMTATGVYPGPILATGGWTKSRALIELRASFFATPLHVVEEPELTALGAALFAASALGGTPSASSTSAITTIDPRPEWMAFASQLG